MKIKLFKGCSFVRKRLSLIIMKAFIFFFCTAAFSLSTNNSFAQEKIQIENTSEVTVYEVFKIVKKQTDYRFLYPRKLFKDFPKVKLEKGEITLDELLKKSFEKGNISFNLTGSNNIIVKENEEKETANREKQNQETQINGVVTDASGVPLPGVNVVVKGTTKGVQTNFDGNYTIEASIGDTLIFSYIGFTTQEVLIKSDKKIDIQLSEDIGKLDEVIVIGYGTRKKSDLTGAIASVSKEQLTARPVASIGDALQGQAPGLLVRTNSAAPGGSTSIVIRGQNSVNSNSAPLYVVDGVPLNDIDNIPVEDIEAIEVLKDASSTAIYGSRGANGVVLITSKKGKIGKPRISYNARTTTQNITNDLNLMDGAEFANTFSQWEIARGTAPTDLFYNGSSDLRPLASEVGTGTDWFDEIMGNGQIQNHQLSVSGGSESNRYSTSLNYLNHDGLVINSGYKRYGFRLSNQTNIAKWLKVDVNLYATHEKANGAGENTNPEGGQGTINQAIKMSPVLPVFNGDGSYTSNNLPTTQGRENPVARVLEETRLVRNWDVVGNFGLTFKILDNLTFRTSGGGDFNNRKRSVYIPSTTFEGGLVDGIAEIYNSNRSHIINENILNYKGEFGMHSLDVIAGMTYEEQTFEDFGARSTGFFTDAFLYDNIDGATSPGAPFSSKSKWQLASYLSRASYNYADKYLLSLTARYDGSSRFGEGNKWGFFPAASAAWVMSRESFLENSKALTFLKLRTGWGRTGNQNIGVQRSLGIFGLANYPIGGNVQGGVAATSLDNPNLQWETTESINLGLDFELFDRVNMSFDWYTKNTTDLLLQVALVETSGFSSALINTGELKNNGIEISMNALVIDKEDFDFRLRVDFFKNRNEIVSLVGDSTQDWRVGQPLGVRRGVLSGGIIRTQEQLDAYVDDNGNPINGVQLGDESAVDINDDGVIDGDDLAVIFDPNPDFSYTISPSFTYKNLSLDFTIYGLEGNQIWNQTKEFLTNTAEIRTNLSRDVLNNTWTPDNPNAHYARLGTQANGFGNQRNIVEDGSFIRLQNVRLGYTLPKTKFYSSASLYISGQNLLTITDYSGFDPDVNSTPGNNSFGIDRNAHPVAKSYTLGLQVNF